VGYRGIRNVLAYLGILPTLEARAEPGRIIYLDARKSEGVVHAPHEGLFESRVDLGEEVEAGQTAGVLYSLDEVDRLPTVLKFPNSGIVCAKHISARVVSGTRTYITVRAASEEAILGSTYG
jgi:predicted deacylase